MDSTPPEIRATDPIMDVTPTVSTTPQPGTVERTTTLAVITVVAFVSNLILLVTIGQSASLRKIHFNKHVVNIAIINLMTCILGMPMVIGYSVTSNWDYGDIMCKVLAHFIISISIAMCLSILMINLDRVIAISDPAKYETSMNAGKTAMMIMISWLVAILFPLPLSLSVVPTAPYPHRYICSIDTLSNIDYLISLYAVCFAVPSLANILFFVYIAREALSEKELESRDGRRRPSAVKLWPEVQSAGVVFILFLLWIVTELPYITLSSIQQYIYSEQVQKQFPYSSHLDTTFMWLKFCDAIILPFVIFKWRKDIWLKFKDLMFCRKSNSVVDASPRGDKGSNKGSNTNSASRRRNKSNSNNASKADTPKFEASFPIPTIKATKDGLHVQGNSEDVADDEIFYADMNMTGKSGDLDAIKTKAVIENYQDIEALNEDEEGDETSDYETDPYSQSDPISVRSTISHSRSHSNPVSDGKEFRTKAHSISVDSGNGSAPSSVKKKRRKKRAVADIPIEPTEVGHDHHIDMEEGQVISSHNNNNVPISVSKKTRKSSSPREHSEALSIQQDDQRIESLEPFVENKSSKRKKKKKKKNLDVQDSETNTSQLVSIELSEKKILPPPRLAPINPDIIQNSINRMATPPLRSKVPREDSEELPPSGDSAARKARRKRISDQNAACEEHSNEEHVATQRSPQVEKAHKKKSKSRHKSGGSDQPLMNSNSSTATVTSELRTVVHHGYQESQI